MQVLIRLGDTLPALAEKYLGSAEQATTLAQFNNLEYPFIVNNPGLVKNIYATGIITVTLLSSPPYTVEVNQKFATTGGASQEIKVYVATSSVTFTATNQTATISVQAVIPGNYSNTLPNTVTNAYTTNLSVTNMLPIAGGKTLRVLVPGDSIYIPDSNNTPSSQITSQLSLKQQDNIGGIDLYFTPDRGLQLTSDDLASSENEITVAQDIAANISTPLGSDPDNPTFGTLIQASLGSAGENSLQRLAVLVQGAAQADNRVQTVGPVSVLPNGTFAQIQLPLILNSGQTSVNVAVPTTGGA